MVDASNVSASCLCGAVRVSARLVGASVGCCHCSMCRKWGGGPLLAVEGVSGVRFEGEDDIAVFASSQWAERGFCRRCGTHLFYRLKREGRYVIPAGLLDGAPHLTFDHQIFVDEKPDYYAFANETKMLTGEQVFAAYGNPPE